MFHSNLSYGGSFSIFKSPEAQPVSAGSSKIATPPTGWRNQAGSCSQNVRAAEQRPSGSGASRDPSSRRHQGKRPNRGRGGSRSRRGATPGAGGPARRSPRGTCRRRRGGAGRSPPARARGGPQRACAQSAAREARPARVADPVWPKRRRGATGSVCRCVALSAKAEMFLTRIFVLRPGKLFFLGVAKAPDEVVGGRGRLVLWAGRAKDSTAGDVIIE